MRGEKTEKMGEHNNWKIGLWGIYQIARPKGVWFTIHENANIEG